MLAEQEFAGIADEDLVIDYIPVKFEKTFTPDAKSAFLPMVTTTEPKKHHADLKIAYAEGEDPFNAGAVFQKEVPLLGRREHFSKAAERCRAGNALRTNNSRCIWYKKITKVCLVVDYLPRKEEEPEPAPASSPGTSNGSGSAGTSAS